MTATVPGAGAGGGAGAESALVERVQRLTAELEALPDPAARACGEQLAAAVVQLYGEGLERIFGALERALDEGGDAAAPVAVVRDELVADGVVASLLLIHGLYPVGLEERVRAALDEVRPYLASHGGDVELLAVQEGVARLRLVGSCRGCAASASTLEAVVEQALEQAAPDLLGLDVEGAAPPSPAAAGGAPAPGAPAPGALPVAGATTWVQLDGAERIERGTLVPADDGLVVANVAGTLLAYRDRCAGCGAALHDGLLLGGTLTCAACGRAYDLPRAGRCRDEDALQLDPIPLLRERGAVRVALVR
ncbi:NifU family protein [Conexibacter woesei]|uniref:Nitrogen-fixing NifU domain protein n=1 Tax=Conexibacter woesei (strain DSM 14684 / CCUG 47730 / CIP 108061 / JCM 11494 / NBRC 100937 / ID131577) TaxID=469383 RepID=D3F8K0_CONWI|nr:NifU family protein [Conexibacter woesei]ADB50964.1 nitrogen-fixing NifU domain protein [Conexibacter woesei DSM 14684]